MSWDARRTAVVMHLVTGWDAAGVVGCFWDLETLLPARRAAGLRREVQQATTSWQLHQLCLPRFASELARLWRRYAELYTRCTRGFVLDPTEDIEHLHSPDIPLNTNWVGW